MNQPIPKQLPGRSLVPFLQGKAQPEHPVFLEWNPFIDYARQLRRCPDWADEDDCLRAVRQRIRTVVTADGWKLNWSDLDKSQLFHMAEDPEELNNLYYNDANATVKDSLQQIILDWQQQQQDSFRY